MKKVEIITRIACGSCNRGLVGVSNMIVNGYLYESQPRVNVKLPACICEGFKERGVVVKQDVIRHPEDTVE